MAILQASLIELAAEALGKVARSTADAEPLARTAGGRPSRLGRLELEEDLRRAVGEALGDLGLALEPFEARVPDLGRKLSLHRAGDNALVQVPGEFLSSDDEVRWLQIGLLEKALQRKVLHLLIFTDATRIHPVYTSGLWIRWVSAKSFELVHPFDSPAIQYLMSRDREARAEQLRPLLELGGGRPAVETAPQEIVRRGELDGPRSGRLARLIQSAFNPESFERFLDYRLDRELDELVSLNATFPAAIRQVIDAAGEEGWTEELVRALCQERRRDEGLERFAAEIGLEPETAPVEIDSGGSGPDGGPG